MEAISQRIAALSESQTMAMNQKTKELQSQGVNVINLSVGEPDFFTPDHIKEAAKKAIDENYSFYSPNPGYPELLTAISNKLKRENNLEYTPSQIIVSNGAKHSLANVLMCLINKGDEVIVPAPYWVSYVELVKLAEGKNIIIDTTVEADWKITAEQLEKAITEKTKALIMCSPSNPTGSVYTKAEIENLVKVLEKHPQVFVISDEIYEHINFLSSHVSFAQFASMKERTFVINGVSKCFAMTGWRIGYVAGPLWMTKACNKLQSQFTSNANTIAQRASLAALNGEQNVVEIMRLAFQRRRDIIIKMLKEIPGLKFNIPQGAFYLFPDASYYYGKSEGETKIKNSDDLSLYLLAKGHIATVPGSAFGNDKCIRISYATSDDKLVEAINRLKNALKELK